MNVQAAEESVVSRENFPEIKSSSQAPNILLDMAEG
jgi:hypothetical protein